MFLGRTPRQQTSPTAMNSADTRITLPPRGCHNPLGGVFHSAALQQYRQSSFRLAAARRHLRQAGTGRECLARTARHRRHSAMNIDHLAGFRYEHTPAQDGPQKVGSRWALGGHCRLKHGVLVDFVGVTGLNNRWPPYGPSVSHGFRSQVRRSRRSGVWRWENAYSIWGTAKKG